MLVITETIFGYQEHEGGKLLKEREPDQQDITMAYN